MAVVDDMDAMALVAPAGPGMGCDQAATQKRLDAVIVEVDAFHRRRTCGSTTLPNQL
jgi:hypothetical protein